jgi:hypothetical protein
VGGVAASLRLLRLDSVVASFNSTAVSRFDRADAQFGGGKLPFGGGELRFSGGGLNFGRRTPKTRREGAAVPRRQDGTLVSAGPSSVGRAHPPSPVVPLRSPASPSSSAVPRRCLVSTPGAATRGRGGAQGGDVEGWIEEAHLPCASARTQIALPLCLSCWRPVVRPKNTVTT